MNEYNWRVIVKLNQLININKIFLTVSWKKIHRTYFKILDEYFSFHLINFCLLGKRLNLMNMFKVFGHL